MRDDDRKHMTARCEICGGHTSSEDHTECSKALKEMYGGEHENKHPLKKYTARRAKIAADYFSKKYRC
jgi:hypothetical protein